MFSKLITGHKFYPGTQVQTDFLCTGFPKNFDAI